MKRSGPRACSTYLDSLRLQSSVRTRGCLACKCQHFRRIRLDKSGAGTATRRSLIRVKRRGGVVVLLELSYFAAGESKDVDQIRLHFFAGGFHPATISNQRNYLVTLRDVFVRLKEFNILLFVERSEEFGNLLLSPAIASSLH